MKALLSAVVMIISNRIASSSFVGNFRLYWYRHGMQFAISKTSSILPDVKFACRKNFSLGSGSVINNGVRIDNRGNVSIGEQTSISYGCIILTAGHDVDNQYFQLTLKDVHIGDYVWIGVRALIQPGVRIGNGAVILPGAVVTSNVPPFSIVGGVPAKPVGIRECVPKYRLSYRPLFPFGF
jgi:acetyltransferase-like isoleucine patch superfamily enzyme